MLTCQALTQAKRSSDISSLLTYICVTPTPPQNVDTKSYQLARSAGTTLLKNVIKQNWKSMPDQSKIYIHENILNGLQDTSLQVRNYTGNVITELVHQGGLDVCVQILPRLVSVVEQPPTGQNGVQAREGAVSALTKLCEDNLALLDSEYQGSRPLDQLLPRIINLVTSDSPKVRMNALIIIENFMTDPPPQTIRDHVQPILEQLFKCATDEDEDVRTCVCRLFSVMTPIFPDLIIPNLGQICDYMIEQMTHDPNSQLAVQAADFIKRMSKEESLRNAFMQLLPKLIPILLETMIYSEEGQIRVQAKLEEDAALADRDSDVKPQFANSRALAGSGSAVADQNTLTDADNNDNEDDDDDDDDDDDEGYDSDPEGELDLRRCSAAAVDTFAKKYRQPVFDLALPFLQTNLVHQDWQNREVGVLVLGAISQGCMESVIPHLPQLVEYLLNLLDDPVYVVREISCWSLSRYVEWVVKDPGAQEKYLQRVIDGLLRRMLDRNKIVQRAAVTAVRTLLDASDGILSPYVGTILQQISKCFELYKEVNQVYLFMVVEALASHYHAEIANPDYVTLLMQPLMSKTDQLENDDETIKTAFACLGYVSDALGPAFHQYAPPLFAKALAIVQESLDKPSDPTAEDEDEMPQDQIDKDFLISGLDLVSAILESYKGSPDAGGLIEGSEAKYFELIAYSLRDSSMESRQSGYAALGDCAVVEAIFTKMVPYLDTILRILISQLDLSLIEKAANKDDREVANRVVNNACWAAGEIALKHGANMSPYLNDLLAGLGNALLSQKASKDVREMAAVAIGRLAIANGQAMAPHLSALAPTFVAVMQNFAWEDPHTKRCNEEKPSAMHGFCTVASLSPAALENCLAGFVIDMAAAVDAGQEPDYAFQEVNSHYFSPRMTTDNR